MSGDGMLQPHRILVYRTASWVYLVGSRKAEDAWRILKLGRQEVGLVVEEDPTTYTRLQLTQLLQTLRDGNQATGGLQFVCRAYAIAGCFSFLEGFYLLFILKRVKLGLLAGHKIFGVERTALLPLLHPKVGRAAFAEGQTALDEARYRRIFGGISLDSSFFFSPTWPLWCRTQDVVAGVAGDAWASQWVWNAHVSQPLRALGHARWVMPLVHGHCIQRQLSLFGRPLSLTLVARRSRHFAGTRFRKRGVNGDGHVANEVELEQIVEADIDRRSGQPVLSSWVQLRGSIPLFWDQDAAGGNVVKPAIVVQQYDPLYSATALHFARLRARYGEPIVVLNLVKQSGREALLGKALYGAIAHLNDRPEARRAAVLALEQKMDSSFVVENVFPITRPQSGEGAPVMMGPPEKPLESSSGDLASNNASFGVSNGIDEECHHNHHSSEYIAAVQTPAPIQYITWDLQLQLRTAPRSLLSRLRRLASPALDSTGMFVSGGHAASSGTSRSENSNGPSMNEHGRFSCSSAPRTLKQHGIIRSNCIDCLDRTNLAQFGLGLCVLGRQLAALGLAPSARDLAPDSSAALALMDVYEATGHAAAQQYGGSEAHAAFFDRARGGWAAATRSRDVLTSLRRLYSNAYTDADKQDSINLLLGVFQPEAGKPALWELGGDTALHRGVGGGLLGRLQWGDKKIVPEVAASSSGMRKRLASGKIGNSSTGGADVRAKSPAITPLKTAGGGSTDTALEQADDGASADHVTLTPPRLLSFQAAASGEVPSSSSSSAGGDDETCSLSSSLDDELEPLSLRRLMGVVAEDSMLSVSSTQPSAVYSGVLDVVPTLVPTRREGAAEVSGFVLPVQSGPGDNAVVSDNVQTAPASPFFEQTRVPQRQVARRAPKLESFDKMLRAPSCAPRPIRLVSRRHEEKEHLYSAGNQNNNTGADRPSTTAIAAATSDASLSGAVENSGSLVGQLLQPGTPGDATPPQRGALRRSSGSNVSSTSGMFNLSNWLSPRGPLSLGSFYLEDEQAGSTPTGDDLWVPSLRRQPSHSARTSPVVAPRGVSASRPLFRSTSADAVDLRDALTDALQPKRRTSVGGRRDSEPLSSSVATMLCRGKDEETARSTTTGGLHRGQTVPARVLADYLDLLDDDTQPSHDESVMMGHAKSMPNGYQYVREPSGAKGAVDGSDAVSSLAKAGVLDIWDSLCSQRESHAPSSRRIAPMALPPATAHTWNPQLPLDIGEVLWGVGAVRHGLDTLGLSAEDAAWWTGDPINSLLGSSLNLKAGLVQDPERWKVPEPSEPAGMYRMPSYTS